ncbi:MAG: alpha-E domain-containing protein, partial [Myxococcota bacterium]
MISRVAESCFWMCRYMERVESTARILAVNRSFVMNAQLPPWARWRPMVIVVGEESGFLERHGAGGMSQGDLVQDYLTWDSSCPVSVHNSLHWARENARTSRETLSLEMWRSINTFWLWLESEEARSLYHTQRHLFYSDIIDRCHQFQGVCYGTMLRHEPYDFMRLGFYLERAGQTARLLDVHQHQLAPAGRAAMSRVEENIFWASVLKSCSAFEMYLKRFNRALCPEDVYRFLVLEPVLEGAPMAALGEARTSANSFCACCR